MRERDSTSFSALLLAFIIIWVAADFLGWYLEPEPEPTAEEVQVAPSLTFSPDGDTGLYHDPDTREYVFVCHGETITTIRCPE